MVSLSSDDWLNSILGSLLFFTDPLLPVILPCSLN